jgi:hypothetical protein
MGFSGQGRGAGAYVTFQNVDLVQSIMGEIEDGLRRESNRELRQAAKEIAKDVLIPQLKRSARSSPMKIAKAFAATAVPKADRVVMVQIGGRAPDLIGFKRGVGEKKANGKTMRHSVRSATSRNYAASMAWGSEYGPFPNAAVNNYGQPRRESGYWVQQGITNAIPEATKRYVKYLNHLIETRSRYR